MNPSRRGVVVKLGGSILDTFQSAARACLLVKSLWESGRWPVVVVSALKGMTDAILEALRGRRLPPDVLDSVLSVGELATARFVAGALRSMGLPAVPIDPSSPLWPVITDSNHGDADPILEECSRVISERWGELVGRKVPVVCGFVGRTRDGALTTLGRGGSDTTAVVLARCLGIREVLLVKDVGGLYSADPRRVRNPRLVESLDADLTMLLSMGGARVLQPKALRYLEGDMEVRLVGLEPAASSSRILGGVPRVRVAVEGGISMYTVVVQDGVGDAVAEILRVLAGLDATLVSMSTLGRAVILYVRGSVLQPLHDALVAKGLVTAISEVGDVSMILVWGRDLERRPGVVSELSAPLAREGINLLGVQTVHSRVALFVRSEHAPRALELVREVVGDEG